ncbi:peptidoglycan DD-metalloendopeptidase family protein [Candidatus Nomurabacteria bacterium]|nr:peptidoglycan DD-metalloendopeptidase family protein [Candidatus Nomurabacteria bacterium]
MKKLLTIIIVATGFAGWLFFFSDNESGDVLDGDYVLAQQEVAQRGQSEAPKYQKDIYTVQPGDTIAKVMEYYGVDYGTMLQLVSSTADTYDLTRIVAGKNFVGLSLDGKLEKIQYDISTEEYLEIFPQVLAVERKPIEYDVTIKAVSAHIESSMFVAGQQAGLTDETILEMAEVLAWNIDFATQVQEGDSFAVVYEDRLRGGQQARPGRILAASFTNMGNKHMVFYFDDGENAGYYDEDGNSTIRQFLRAPLKYSRITSGFTYARFHPVTKQTTPHRAIDYAAPIGTPVMATADGTVVYAGYNGGYGNFVKVRHNGIYQTHYAHLSRYGTGIKYGVHVKQGQIIGYVGSTGFSTGPHLHYEIQKNGTLVNPLEIELPPGDPIKEQYREEFEKVKKEYIKKI